MHGVMLAQYNCVHGCLRYFDASFFFIYIHRVRIDYNCVRIYSMLQLYLLTTQQAGQTDWGPLSNRWTGNVHFSLFSIFWSSSTQRIPRPSHQACHNLDQNTSRKAGADLDHCSFLGSVHTGAKPKITVFRYKQILPVLLPAVPERTLL